LLAVMGWEPTDKRIRSAPAAKPAAALLAPR
jgi:hypothetical protein